MDRKIVVKPKHITVSPDQRSAEVMVAHRSGADLLQRPRIVQVPKGMQVEKQGRGRYEISWDGPLKQPVHVVFGVERPAGVERCRVLLSPNDEELAKYEAQGDELDGKLNEIQDDLKEGLAQDGE